jgi:hypothetical protein
MQAHIDRKELLAKLQEARAVYYSHKEKQTIEYLQALHQLAQVKITPELHKLDTFAPSLENDFAMPLLMRVFEYDPKSRPSMGDLPSYDKYIDLLSLSGSDMVVIDDNDAQNLTYLGVKT